MATSVNFKKYLAGFLSSLILTLSAYFLTKHHLSTHHVSPSDNVMQVSLIILAIVQLMAQLFFFLHLGQETKPRWKTWAAAFAVLVVLIVVIGSLWIMDNLNYRMTQAQINNYLKDQDGGI